MKSKIEQPTLGQTHPKFLLADAVRILVNSQGQRHNAGREGQVRRKNDGFAVRAAEKGIGIGVWWSFCRGNRIWASANKANLPKRSNGRDLCVKRPRFITNSVRPRLPVKSHAYERLYLLSCECRTPSFRATASPSMPLLTRRFVRSNTTPAIGLEFSKEGKEGGGGERGRRVRRGNAD